MLSDERKPFFASAYTYLVQLCVAAAAAAAAVRGRFIVNICCYWSWQAEPKTRFSINNVFFRLPFVFRSLSVHCYMPDAVNHCVTSTCRSHQISSPMCILLNGTKHMLPLIVAKRQIKRLYRAVTREPLLFLIQKIHKPNSTIADMPLFMRIFNVVLFWPAAAIFTYWYKWSEINTFWFCWMRAQEGNRFSLAIIMRCWHESRIKGSEMMRTVATVLCKNVNVHLRCV